MLRLGRWYLERRKHLLAAPRRELPECTDEVGTAGVAQSAPSNHSVERLADVIRRRSRRRRHCCCCCCC
jgi:hypothetical protein